MDSTAQTAPAPSEIFNETISTGDPWIRQRKQPLWALKSSTKTESLHNQKSSTKQLPRVRHGLDIANSPCGHRNHQRNCFHGSRMRSTAQTTLGFQKASTKLLLRVTHAFDSANSPCGLRNHQQKLSRWRLKNHQRNYFHG